MATHATAPRASQPEFTIQSANLNSDAPVTKKDRLVANILTIEQFIKNHIPADLGGVNQKTMPSVLSANALAEFKSWSPELKNNLKTRLWQVLGYPKGANFDVAETAMNQPKVQNVSFEVSKQQFIEALETALKIYESQATTPRKHGHTKKVHLIIGHISRSETSNAVKAFKTLPLDLQEFAQAEISKKLGRPIVENTNLGQAVFSEKIINDGCISGVTIIVTWPHRAKALELVSDALVAELGKLPGLTPDQENAAETFVAARTPKRPVAPVIPAQIAPTETPSTLPVVPPSATASPADEPEATQPFTITAPANEPETASSEEESTTKKPARVFDRIIGAIGAAAFVGIAALFVYENIVQYKKQNKTA